MRRICVAFVLMLFSAALVLPPLASGSDLVGRRTKKEVLKVNKKGIAMVYFRTRKLTNHIAYWGAVNANMRRKSTLRFRKDRSGGLMSNVADYRHFKDACRRYTGPKLPYVIDSCTARDGSHWVLQKWARNANNYGGSVAGGEKELRLSHFTWDPAVLEITPNWSWGGKYMHIVATLSYHGKPWYAIGFKPSGYVTDQIGRNVNIDSFSSDLGSGWRRVNAVLTHRPSGQLCFGFTPKVLPGGGSSGSGYSSVNRYRLSVPGPGVSPDIEQEFAGVLLEDYDPAIDDVVDQLIRDLIGNYTGRHNCQHVN